MQLFLKQLRPISSDSPTFRLHRIKLCSHWTVLHVSNTCISTNTIYDFLNFAGKPAKLLVAKSSEITLLTLLRRLVLLGAVLRRSASDHRMNAFTEY